MVKVGLLKLLVTWLDESSPAVKVFLALPQNLPFLVELVLAPPDHHGVHVQGLAALLIGLCFQLNEDDSSTQFSKSSLQSIILQRIGVDQFLSKFDALRKTGEFISAEQGNEEIEIEEDRFNYYHSDFTHLFKAASDKIQRQLKSPGKAFGKSTEGPVDSNQKKESSDHLEAVIISYKELIKIQDNELESLKARNQELEIALQNLSKSSQAQASDAISQAQESESEANMEKSDNNAINQQFEITQNLSKELTSLSTAYNELEKANFEKEEKIKSLLLFIDELKEKLANKSQNELGESTDRGDLSTESEQLKLTVNSLTEEKTKLIKQLEESQKKVKDGEQMYASLEKEQEELLLALANQEIENNNLQARLDILEADKNISD